jgi:hypothetical protein
MHRYIIMNLTAACVRWEISGNIKFNKNRFRNLLKIDLVILIF